MKRAVLVTGHYWESRRKAGFHWIADALLRDGWEVLFKKGDEHFHIQLFGISYSQFNPVIAQLLNLSHVFGYPFGEWKSRKRRRL